MLLKEIRYYSSLHTLYLPWSESTKSCLGQRDQVPYEGVTESIPHAATEDDDQHIHWVNLRKREQANSYQYEFTISYVHH